MRSLWNRSKKGHGRTKADWLRQIDMFWWSKIKLGHKGMLEESVSNHMHVSSWLPVCGPLRLHRCSFWKVASSGLDVLCVSRDTPVSVYTRFAKNLSYLSKLTRLYGNRFDIFFSILESLPQARRCLLFMDLSLPPPTLWPSLLYLTPVSLHVISSFPLWKHPPAAAP